MPTLIDNVVSAALAAVPRRPHYRATITPGAAPGDKGMITWDGGRHPPAYGCPLVYVMLTNSGRVERYVGQSTIGLHQIRSGYVNRINLIHEESHGQRSTDCRAKRRIHAAGRARLLVYKVESAREALMLEQVLLHVFESRAARRGFTVVNAA